MAREILVAYLFAAGPGRWRPTAFERVWCDCVLYFDPKKSKLEFVLYAPIAGMSGVARHLALGSGLEIRRLGFDEMARLASLDPAIAGVSLHHRFTLWPVHFFVARFDLEKAIGPRESSGPGRGPLWDWPSHLNDEVGLLRSLLAPDLAVPTYAVIRDGYPRDPGGRQLQALPWRPRIIPFAKPRSRREIASYARRRTKFLGLHGASGWGGVAASIRRFAVAWENPFPADRLADIVAALERLIVRGEMGEVSYKLRVRTAYLLAKSVVERQAIFKDLKDAYSYRSRVDHGEFIFDDIREWRAAIRMGRAKGKKGNPFYDINEVHRLVRAVSSYYRRALQLVIDRGRLEIDWAARGL